MHGIQLERRGLRANVEETVSTFERKVDNSKLKVRQYFKTQVFAFSAGIGIDCGRISRFLKTKRGAQIQ